VQTFRTNIKCGGCVSKVKPFLDELKDVKSWQVDLNSPDRTLTVDGEISPELVSLALAKAGYKGDKIG
jgi:copper chaperone